jgi:molybdopterin synthase catalytic subunit
VIELRHAPLSLGECVEAVRRPGSGGIATFIGCVRETSEGKKVRYLEYEAYEPMALRKLQQLVDEVRARWPVQAVAIQHRLGKLDIGEDAVIIAVATPHRAEAFAACQYAIDRLKEIVPIWKKEYGEGGEVWVGGPTLETAGSSRGPAPD